MDIVILHYCENGKTMHLTESGCTIGSLGAAPAGRAGVVGARALGRGADDAGVTGRQVISGKIGAVKE
jgi:hypothetical protein